MTNEIQKVCVPDTGPFDLNEHGLWCPHCGEIIAAPWNMDDDYQAPDSCKSCGFPDFEDGFHD